MRECEELIKCMQSRDNSWLDLATNLWVVTRQNVSHVWSMQDNWITTGQRLQTDLSVIWQLELTTHPNHEWLASAPYFDFSHSLSYPTINTLIPIKCRELLERILRDKENNKIDSSTILYIWFSKFLYSHPLHYHTLKRILSQILTSPHSEQWEGYWCLGSSSRENQFILVDAMG